VRSRDNQMVPIGALAELGSSVGQSLISLYNLYPTATIIAAPARGASTGQGITATEEIAAKTLPSDVGYQWTAMSYQEKLTGNQLYYLFGLSVLLVYLCLAGQYGSWILPLAVLFVPSFFAVLQKLEERRSAKKAPPAIQAATTAK